MGGEIEKMFWKESSSAGESKAIGHAWVQFKHCPAGVMIEVNEIPALRISLKYRDTGPYLGVEIAPGSSETMGSCMRTSAMVQHYEKILEAHNAAGEVLHAARSFLIKDIKLEVAAKPGVDWRPIDTLTGDGPVIVIRKGWLPHTAQRVGDSWKIPGTGAGIPFHPTHWCDVLIAPDE